ncbi:MAG: response regulator [Myxococcaceae bacterium]|nr:response regulator [Myxococcaceae bacterium]
MSRLLIVDDEPEVVDLLAKVLVRAGHEVRTAGCGEDALRVLQDGYDAELLLVDKMLPRMHGAEVIVAARRLKPAVAVILLTAFPEPFAVPPERLDGYLAKPFKSLAQVEEAVKDALEGAAAARRREELRTRLNQVVADLTPAAKNRA